MRLLCSRDSPGNNTGVGCHFPPLGESLQLRDQTASPELASDSLPPIHQGSPAFILMVVNYGWKRSSCLRTAIENYVIRCKIIQTSYVYSRIKAIFLKSQRIFNTGLTITVYRPQSERVDCSRLEAQGLQRKLLCHVSHVNLQML